MEETINSTLADANMLYCRHCMKPISKDADACPNCGNNDPFYLKAIKGVEKNLKVSWWFYVFVAFLVEITFSLCGWSNGILHWRFPQIAVFVLVCALAHILVWMLRKSVREKYEQEMTEVFTKVGSIEAMSRWRSMVNTLIG